MTVIAHDFVNQKGLDAELEIEPVAGRIGAEIHGIDLTRTLDENTVSAIREALNHHKVIFFRNQQGLDNESHERFAAQLGEPVSHPTVPVAENSRYLLDLNSNHEGFSASSWHTDVTFTEAYPAFSILRAIDVPKAGGDTQWANTATAYEYLPKPLKTLVDELWAVHTNLYDYAEVLYSEAAHEERNHYIREVFASTVYETEHPVVHVHPETGERNLLLGHFVKRFVGLNSTDSQRLLGILQDHITRPENVVRWHWKNGDVAIWDNRATQHRATGDFGTQRRHLRRATVAGVVPVSLQGERSRNVKKEPGKSAQTASA